MHPIWSPNRPILIRKAVFFMLTAALTLFILPKNTAHAYLVSHDMHLSNTPCASHWDCPPSDTAETLAGTASLTVPGSSSSAHAEPLRYEVRTGDTLYGIARSFNIPVSSLLGANPVIEANKLAVGQILEISPVGSALVLPAGQSGVVEAVLSSTLTAYTAGVESTGKSPGSPEYGITYSGERAAEGRTVAVDPKVIPLGTLVYIDGVGVRRAEDIGSAIRGSRIDVFMEDVKEARAFGVKKNVRVYVLSGGET